MFESCFAFCTSVITTCFNWAESIWGSFGISLIGVVTVFIVSCFLVRNYIQAFLK